MRKLTFGSIFSRIHRKISLLNVNYHTLFSLEEERKKWKSHCNEEGHIGGMHTKTRWSLKNNQQNFVNIWCISRCYAAFVLFWSIFHIANVRLINNLPTMLHSCCIIYHFFFFSSHFIPGIALISSHPVWDFFLSLNS